MFLVGAFNAKVFGKEIIEKKMKHLTRYCKRNTQNSYNWSQRWKKSGLWSVFAENIIWKRNIIHLLMNSFVCNSYHIAESKANSFLCYSYHHIKGKFENRRFSLYNLA
jgi:hypothetical protein